MPLTADQAAVTFGTHERFVRDDTDLIARWKTRASDYEVTARDRREYQQRLLDVTRRTQFTADCAEWVQGSQASETLYRAVARGGAGAPARGSGGAARGGARSASLSRLGLARSLSFSHHTRRARGGRRGRR